MESAAGARQVWTTFSADQADINFSDPGMILRLVDVLLFYIEQGARFIRLDAIAFLWKVVGTSCIHLPETHRAVQLFRTVAEAVNPEIVIITETNVPHALNVSYFDDGTNEAHWACNFALPPWFCTPCAQGAQLDSRHGPHRWICPAKIDDV
jgi:sucrose phosphorylase